MTTPDSMTMVMEAFEDRTLLDEAQMAAAAYLARYRGRTLDAYRHDLRTFFQWAADIGPAVLNATRPHIEMYRTMLEGRGWPPQPSTAAHQPCAVSTGLPTSTAGRLEPGPICPPPQGLSD